ncbi:hypothetical protein BO78DRAFT_393575 [Aspergillus sclerotiicarbonarius CBS 121057]|uniref:Uncharacterized protein n=1 Tax=Aspergillus sclerotiicarbonarius (strain CBS 121057 / IBT 28362) TaxID=1448318 RepID=A0A319EU53_ASPSB|nr:hypothetical protein BO78DRAFT_393575 [Aspergillus sclerotiicarbonarius CBS 121057]
MSTVKKLTPEQFKSRFDGVFHGSPDEARSYMQGILNPNYIWYQAGSNRTDFERAVEKATYLRTNCKKWDSSLMFFAQDENRIAARLVADMALGDMPETKVEVMMMLEVDEERKWVAAWEQATEFLG